MTENCGDGSYCPRFTFNAGWIAEQEKRDAKGELDFEQDIGCDGDGFHYTTLILPDDVTLKSMGINKDCAKK